MRIAFEKAGGVCVFSSENNKFAQQTYETNFGDLPHGDITKIDESEIPDHDILLAGFPCQPLSLAGVSKNNSLGTEHGFNRFGYEPYNETQAAIARDRTIGHFRKHLGG